MINKYSLTGLIYITGVLHWLFFFYFVDYYNYTNEKFINKSTIINDTKYLIELNSEDELIFKGPVSIQGLSNHFLVKDKKLLKEIAKNPSVSSLFKKKTFTLGDLSQEYNMQRVIKYSLKNLIMPFHSPHGVGGAPKNERWLASPSYISSPQVLLLYFLDTQTFVLINLLILYSIGFIGCLLIKNHYKLNNLTFSLFFLIFNFNGYIVEKIPHHSAHISGYYFLPFIFYFIFKISETEYKNKHLQLKYAVLIGIFLTAILFQGSIHLYSISISFIIYWLLFNYRYWLAIVSSLIISFATSAVRILPASISYSASGNPRYWEWGGYGSLEFFFKNVIFPGSEIGFPANSHEFSLYISLPGLLIIFYFGCWAPFINTSWLKFHKWKKFFFPTLIIFIISFGHLKHYFIPHFIPLLNSESLTTRYVIVPLIIVTIVSIINLQGFLDYYNKSKKIKIFMIIWIGSIALFLLNHSRTWRMHQTQSIYEWSSFIHSEPLHTVADSIIINNTMNDNIYIVFFWIGLGITIISLICSLWYLLIKKWK